MNEYIVSARKYRPASFDTVVGQRALTTTLLNAIKTNKLAHAYLFCGPRGVGKTTCARIFAKTINCTNPKENGEACNECESCRTFEEGRSMNIHELDAASNNSVDDIRELIQQVQIPPQTGRYKVFIIDEVHMLSASAFNAFLKTLEEPPSYVVFVMATTEKHKILPTILSRCQVYDFARMTLQNTVDHLRYVAEKEGYTTDEESLNLIAQKADGGMRDALSIFDQMVSFTGGEITYEKTLANLNVLDAEYYFRLVDHFQKHEVEPCMLLLNEVIMKGFDPGNFISGLAAHMRNLLVARDPRTVCLLEVSENMKARYQQQAATLQPKFIYRTIKLCNDCDQSYRTSRNKRLQVEICLIQAAQEDVPGSGRRPKTLLPLFTVPAAQQTGQQTVASANARPATTAATTAAQPAQAAQQQTAAAQQPTAAAQSQPGATQRQQPVATPSQPPTGMINAYDNKPTQEQTASNNAQNAAPKLKTIKLGQFGPSITRRTESSKQNADEQNYALFGNMGNPAAGTAQAGPGQVASAWRDNAGSTEPSPYEPQSLAVPQAAPKQRPLNDNDLRLYWLEAANMLPVERTALAQRMRDSLPTRHDDTHFVLHASNPQVMEEYQKLLPNIQRFFCTRFCNPSIEGHVIMDDINMPTILSKPKILEMMKERNPAVEQLISTLKLMAD